MPNRSHARPDRSGRLIALVGGPDSGCHGLALELRAALTGSGVSPAHVRAAVNGVCAAAPDFDAARGIAEAAAQALHRHAVVIVEADALVLALGAGGSAAPDLQIRIDLCLLATPPAPPVPGDGATGRLRQALLRAGIAHSVLAGPAEGRLAAALAAWQAASRPRDEAASGAPRWRHGCARCGDGDCERHLFESLRPGR